MSRKYFSSSSLKIIAISLMLIDHIAASNLYKILANAHYFQLPGYQYSIYVFMRLIGRLAFPIFAFLIAEGFYYTKNFNRYLTRLFIFALISEIPFDLVYNHTLFSFDYQNVFFTLTIGLIAIYLFNLFKDKSIYIGYITLFLCGILSIILRTDYSFAGILMIFCFYYFRGHFIKIVMSIFFINFILIYDSLYHFDIMGIIQIFSVLSLIFIYYYNHKRGYRLKYLFYLFYPVHLLVLYFLINYCK
ncbi:hypothetical protein KHQ81_00085 [Mycoplasmatota bacterium]|nr:hypothetical protein KHQ81_00085 [Mycoplasmatota bacterium]